MDGETSGEVQSEFSRGEKEGVLRMAPWVHHHGHIRTIQLKCITHCALCARYNPYTMNYVPDHIVDSDNCGVQNSNIEFSASENKFYN